MAETKSTSAFKRVQILGDAAIITSKLKLETILKLQARNDKVLCLAKQDQDGFIEEFFRVEASSVGTLSQVGITFTSKNKKGLAQTTVKIPNGVENKKRFIVEEFGAALCMLEQVEEQAIEAEKVLDKMYADLEKQIVEVEVE